MKKLFALFCLLLTPTVSAAEKQVPMPADGDKLYVSLYVASSDQVPVLDAQVKQYKAGNHYNVYKQSDPMYKSRFAGVPVPSAFVQKADGTVIFATCPWRKPKPQPKPEPDEPATPDEPVTPEPDNSPSPWLYLGVVGIGLAVGAGSKFVQEMKAK